MKKVWATYTNVREGLQFMLFLVLYQFMYKKNPLDAYEEKN